VSSVPDYFAHVSVPVEGVTGIWQETGPRNRNPIRLHHSSYCRRLRTRDILPEGYFTFPQQRQCCVHSSPFCFKIERAKAAVRSVCCRPVPCCVRAVHRTALLRAVYIGRLGALDRLQTGLFASCWHVIMEVPNTALRSRILLSIYVLCSRNSSCFTGFA
jgi:hypothetical protein